MSGLQVARKKLWFPARKFYSIEMISQFQSPCQKRILLYAGQRPLRCGTPAAHRPSAIIPKRHFQRRIEPDA
jgi:hypothetical protein